MSDLSAKDFQAPLLQVLMGLAGGAAGVPVTGSDTYGPVMARMGIPSIDAHGKEASSGLPMVQRWISWAVKNLRNTGHVELEGRGRWMLTPKGVQEASGMHLVTTPAPVPTPAPVVRPAHLDDPYILQLAIAQTRCFGYYTPHKGAECATCPVMTDCRSHQHTAYIRAAARFAAEDAQAQAQAAQAQAAKAQATQAPVAQAPVAQAPARPSAAAVNGPPKQTRKADLAEAMKTRVFAETTCWECGKVIPKDDLMYWTDDIHAQEARVFHVACYENLP